MCPTSTATHTHSSRSRSSSGSASYHREQQSARSSRSSPGAHLVSRVRAFSSLGFKTRRDRPPQLRTLPAPCMVTRGRAGGRVGWGGEQEAGSRGWPPLQASEGSRRYWAGRRQAGGRQADRQAGSHERAAAGARSTAHGTPPAQRQLSAAHLPAHHSEVVLGQAHQGSQVGELACRRRCVCVGAPAAACGRHGRQPRQRAPPAGQACACPPAHHKPPTLDGSPALWERPIKERRVEGEPVDRRWAVVHQKGEGCHCNGAGRERASGAGSQATASGRRQLHKQQRPARRAAPPPPSTPSQPRQAPHPWVRESLSWLAC